jgi:hypothetical protein
MKALVKERHPRSTLVVGVARGGADKGRRSTARLWGEMVDLAKYLFSFYMGPDLPRSDAESSIVFFFFSSCYVLVYHLRLLLCETYILEEQWRKTTA